MKKVFDLFKIDIDPNRIYGLDILRACAIMFVVIGHGSFLLPNKLGRLCNFLDFDGVAIFFVLSGFLIGGILIKTIEKNGFTGHILKDFWIRRWFRTLPNYFLILIILCVLHFLFDSKFVFSNVIQYFFFSQNLFYKTPDFFLESWSLSIEEWFYLVFPTLVILASSSKKNFKRSILLVSIFIILSVTAFRYYRYETLIIHTTSEWDSVFRKQVITRLDSIMFGVVGAYINYYYRDLWPRFKKQLLIFGLILFIVSKFILPRIFDLSGLYFCVFSFTLNSVATLCLLPYLSNLKSGKGLLRNAITYISLISYSMYLLNLSIIQDWILRNIPWKDFLYNDNLIYAAKYGTYWVLVVGLSILIYKYFEIPMTALRERFK